MNDFDNMTLIQKRNYIARLAASEVDASYPKGSIAWRSARSFKLRYIRRIIHQAESTT